jgi:hypothetical protein
MIYDMKIHFGIRFKAEAKIYTFSYCTLKDFIMLSFQTLIVMNNRVEIVGILDFTDNTSWDFKNM